MPTTVSKLIQGTDIMLASFEGSPMSDWQTHWLAKWMIATLGCEDQRTAFRRRSAVTVGFCKLALAMVALETLRTDPRSDWLTLWSIALRRVEGLVCALWT